VHHETRTVRAGVPARCRPAVAATAARPGPLKVSVMPSGTQVVPTRMCITDTFTQACAAVRVPWSRSTRSARARATRERIVPTGQPQIPAASAYSSPRTCVSTNAARRSSGRVASRRWRAISPAGSGLWPGGARRAPSSPRRRAERTASAQARLAIASSQVLVEAVNGPAGGAPGHLARELGSFDLALTVGFLMAAWQPARAFGLLPLVGALAVGLVATSAIDVASGNVPVGGEAFHALDLVGFVLVWRLARFVRPPRLRVSR
jgi:hypothetical protein